MNHPTSGQAAKLRWRRSHQGKTEERFELASSFAGEVTERFQRELVREE